MLLCFFTPLPPLFFGEMATGHGALSDAALQSKFSMDCIIVHRANAGNSYSYKGYKLTKSTALTRKKEVIIALECAMKRKSRCTYKVIVKECHEKTSALYLESGFHNHGKPHEAYLMSVDFAHSLRNAISMEHSREEAHEIYKDVKLKLGLPDAAVPPFDQVMASVLRKRRRERNETKPENFPEAIVIPPRNVNLDCFEEANHAIKSARKALMRIGEIDKLEKELRNVMTLVNNQERNLDTLEILFTAQEVAQRETENEIQVLQVVNVRKKYVTKNKTDLLKLARPRRPFPQIEQCGICFHAYNNIVYYGCGKICACLPCAIDMRERFITCLCCNQPATLDEDGKAVLQVVS